MRNGIASARERDELMGRPKTDTRTSAVPTSGTIAPTGLEGNMATYIQNIKDIDFVASILRRYGRDVLDVLLKDRTTGKNIIWADQEYVNLGVGYEPYDEITVHKISDRRTIEPRVVKSVDQQAWRTKEKAEVFTPSWLCKQMVDCMDDAFFGVEPSGFSNNSEDCPSVDYSVVREGKLREGDLWKKYVDNRLLEITCGEAPFICSPYDATTGDIVPVSERIGFLDRKLKVVKTFTNTYEEWYKWALRAVQASYGYEYQGDNLLIARINVFNTFMDYLSDAWGKQPELKEALEVAKVISWNIWQMDGLRGCVPSEWDVPETQDEDMQTSMFDIEGFWNEEEETETETVDEQAPLEFAQMCVIYDWRARKKQEFVTLKD